MGLAGGGFQAGARTGGGRSRSEHYLQKGGKSRDAEIQVMDDGGLMLEKELQGSRKVRDSERSLGASSQREWGMDEPQRVRQMEARMLRFGVQATRKKAEPLTETGNMDGGGGDGKRTSRPRSPL